MSVILKEKNNSKELCPFVSVFIVKVASDLRARQCGGSKAHCLSAHLLPAQLFASNPNMTWEKMHLENGRSLEPNPIQVHLELGSILGGKAS